MKKSQAADLELFCLKLDLHLQGAVIERAQKEKMTVDSWIRLALREKLAGKSMTYERRRKLEKIVQRLGWAMKRLEEFESA